MRKHFLNIILALCIVTTSTQAQNALLEGQVTTKQKYVYLDILFGSKTQTYDSAKIINNKFSFVRKPDFQRGFYKLHLNNKEKSVLLVLSNETITVKGDLETTGSVSVTNSKENEVYFQYQQLNNIQNTTNTKLNQQAESLKNQQLPAQEFESKMLAIQAKFDSSNVAYTSETNKLIANNPNLFISKVMGMFVSIDHQPANQFFYNADLNDEELTHGDMLSSKITMYFQRYVSPDLNAWKQASTELLQRFPAPKQNREILYLTLIDIFTPYDADFTRDLCEAYHKEYPTSYYAKKALAKAPKGSIRIGEEAPNISLTSPDGKVISLKSLRGKVVLIDFWASWCGPCRMENPNVVKAYNTYKDKGFTVFSVSLDENAEKWKAAIAKDGLIWPNHVSDLKGWKSSAASTYNVKGIPMTLLINENGFVVAQNLRGPALEQKLQELLEKK
jgi:thiol-disulfide isomerase/thioredoxin